MSKKIESCTLPRTLDSLNGEQLSIKKYIDEISERKRLYNELIELEGNIRVFCRFRSLNETEIANGSLSIIESISSHGTDLVVVSPDSSRKHFTFHQVFKPGDGQEAVFARTKPFVISVLDGYDVCIFSYGLTGAEKTFTLEGTPNNWGVNYRILEELFQFCREQNVMQYKITVSMMEVYNEKIKDLLVENSNQPTKRWEIEPEAEGIQEVPDFSEALVHNIEELQVLLMSHGATKVNNLSGRSHRLMRVAVNRSNLRTTQTTRSHLWLIDLAVRGPVEVQGERLEAQLMDKSVSALADVISSLLSKTDNLRFGDSKLTHLLQRSLGGDCKTLMFVQISPSPADFQESLSALNFSLRVQAIKNSPAAELAEEERLKKEQFDQLRVAYQKFRVIENRAQNGLVLLGGLLMGVVSLVMSVYGSAWLMTDLFCPHQIVTPILMHICFGFTIIFAGYLFWMFADGYRKELGTQISIPVRLERVTRGMRAPVGEEDEENGDGERLNVAAKESIRHYKFLKLVQTLMLICYFTVLISTLVTLQGVTKPNCFTTVPIPLEPLESTVPNPLESTPTIMQASTEQLIRQSIGRSSGITRWIRLQLSLTPGLEPFFYGNDTFDWI